MGLWEMEPKRREVKLVCDERFLADVRSWVRLHPALFTAAYPPRQVNNLYFDTLESSCLYDNLDGTGERGKLRLRWYGTDFSAVRGALELKRKSNQLGWKLICPVPATLDLRSTSWRDLMERLRGFAEGAMALWLSTVDRPMLLNSYTREYYESADRQSRVTIDYAQDVYEQWTHPAPNLSFKTPASGQVVIEVKADSGQVGRLSDITSIFPLSVGRNSKYARGVLDSFGYLNRMIR
jgi:hypothetical protein